MRGPSRPPEEPPDDDETQPITAVPDSGGSDVGDTVSKIVAGWIVGIILILCSSGAIWMLVSMWKDILS